MKLNVQLNGVQEVKQALGMMSKKIMDSIFVAQQETAIIGEEFAKNAAPYYTGAVASNISNHQLNQYAWVITSQTPSSDNLPINVLFDTGEYEIITGQKPRDINTLFFMQQTSIFVSDEYSRRLNFIIKSNLKK